MTVAWFTPLAALLGNAVASGVERPLSDDVLDTHIREAGIQASGLQMISYLLVVLCLAVICAIALLHPEGRGLRGWGSFVASTWIAAFLAVSVALKWWSGWWFVAGFATTLLAISVLANFPEVRDRIHRTPHLRTVALSFAAVVVAAYLAVSMIWPLAHVMRLSSSAELAQADSHYAVTLLPGFDFICCQQTGSIEHAGYGLAMPLLTALALRAMSAFGHGTTDLLAVVRIYQVVALALILICLRLLNGRRFVWLAPIAILTTLYLGLDIDGRPNLVGIRYLPFLFGTLVLILLARNRSRPSDYLVAAGTTAMVILGSPESGLAVACGFAVFLVVANYRPKAPARSVAFSASVYVVAVACLFVVSTLLAGRLLSPKTSFDGFSNAALFASGNGGSVDPWIPGASIVALFGSLAVASGVSRARVGRATRIDAFQCGVGAAMLAWLLYYIDRPLDSSLWFEFVLLLILWAPRLQVVNVSVVSSRIGSVAPYAWLAAAVVGGLLASTLVGTVTTLADVPDQLAPCDERTLVIQGRCLTSPDAPELAAHLNALAQIDDKGEYLVLSFLPSQVRIMGFNEGFPWYDPFFEVSRRQQQDAIVAWIDRHGPAHLLAEDPRSSLARQLPNRAQHQAAILRRLESYELVGSRAGWLTYQRRQGLG